MITNSSIIRRRHIISIVSEKSFSVPITDYLVYCFAITAVCVLLIIAGVTDTRSQGIWMKKKKESRSLDQIDRTCKFISNQVIAVAPTLGAFPALIMANGLGWLVVIIAQQLDEGYRIGIRRHNEEVTKNRHILSRIIDCVKFCGAFELALRGHDESEGSDNPGIFRGLVDFVASLDGVLKEHLENATVFKGTSKTVQNELLDCMLSVVREQIIQDVQSSDFLSIQADETTDIATQCQLVLVLRYIDAKSNVQERFFEFIPLRSTTADSIATVLKERLAVILPEDQKSKLISQTYDGASVMRGATAGVQRKMQDVYPNAHYIHCYAHQLNLIMQQATSHISKVRIFFSDLGGFSSFFSRSPKRTDVLDKVVAHRLPTSSNVRWNFHSRAINTVFEHREDLIRCFQSIRDSGDFDPVTVREAGAFAMLLENQDFKFFLQLFHNIMPHVDLLYAKLQKKDIDSVHIRGSIQQFQQDIQKIRNSLHSLVDQCSEGGSQPKRRRSLSPEVHERIAAEVCDTILRHTLERFSFTDHLVSATLLQADRFEQYTMAFPEDALSRTLKAYPVLDGRSGLSPGAIAGISAAVLVLLTAAAAAVFYFHKQGKSKGTEQNRNHVDDLSPNHTEDLLMDETSSNQTEAHVANETSQ
ncbi:zinc finger MYM-type 1-like protein [Labeo rohita]|uniref:Zinc finger MYM-type 1-like protein n=1 Tax=Labeo rohita TaxID=84645 RepID=A0A498NUC0_LABRO|nr:zinc finger MYM-type 1-like protein [Labeo rohita]